MISSHDNVNIRTAHRIKGGLLACIGFCLPLLLVLSIWLAQVPALAQSRGFGANSGGALGGLLEQLQTLQGTGAIDALEGRAASNLDAARQAGSNVVEKFKNEASTGKTTGSQGMKRHSLLNQQELQLAERYCRGETTPEQGAAIRLARQFSPLEKDYCQRASELLLQYGYDLFDTDADLRELNSGTVFPDYVVGIDDEFVITFIGRINQSLTVRVDRTGRLLLPKFKPIFAAGHSFGEIRREIVARTAANI